MKFKFRHIDIPLLIITAILVLGGLFVFASASLGLLARSGATFGSVAFSQIILGVFLGSLLLLFVSQIDYRKYKKFSPWLFAVAFLLTFLVFIPGLGITLKGATRWILLGPISFQPAELLKIAYIFFLAFLLTNIRSKKSAPFLPFILFTVVTSLAGVPLLLQPDTGTFLVIVGSGLLTLFASGARIRELVVVVIIGAFLLGGFAYSRPYIQDRLLTFVDPSRDPLGSGYQIQQSLIAIGSGEVFGRGYGKGVQKFNYLPEPVNDSIFAVYAEELGFVGSIFLLLLYIAFLVRSFQIAARAPDYFGALVVLGLGSMVVGQSLLNIGAMLSVVPLTGLPLVFLSQGGTAMLFALLSTGVILSVSRYQRRG